MKTNESKELLKKWGVYKIINMLNQEFYIGSTTESFGKRLGKHISDYYSDKRRSCPKFYKAVDEFGIDNFEFFIIKYFNRKKDSLTNKRIVTYIEEKLIEKLSPKYNICKSPTLSGCPNLGRKLSTEWKNNIREKSKLYKHKSNTEVYNRKSQQNKDSSTLYRVFKSDGTEIIGSATEIIKIPELSNIFRWHKGEALSNNGWVVEKLKEQKKKIRIFNSDEDITFNSFGECDRYLNMWRGFTSTQVVNNKNKILNYKYEVLTIKI